MLNVGLTGGIGSGKSTVAARLAEFGAVVIDSDRIAREVTGPGTEALAEIAAEFGSVLTPSGSLDRGALAAIVFADPARRSALDRIVHPRVRARAAELVGGAPSDSIAINDVPLLVENSLAPTFHLAIVVEAPAPARLARLVARGLGEADAQARIDAQASDAERRAACDEVIDNSGSPADLEGPLGRLWRRLTQFEHALRHGTTPRPDSSGDRSPATVARWIARLGRAFPMATITAVPEVGETPVIEVSEPAAYGARLAEALRSAGLIATGGPWAESADPGRPLRVRIVGA